MLHLHLTRSSLEEPFVVESALHEGLVLLEKGPRQTQVHPVVQCQALSELRGWYEGEVADLHEFSNHCLESKPKGNQRVSLADAYDQFKHFITHILEVLVPLEPVYQFLCDFLLICKRLFRSD